MVANERNFAKELISNFSHLTTCFKTPYIFEIENFKIERELILICLKINFINDFFVLSARLQMKNFARKYLEENLTLKFHLKFQAWLKNSKNCKVSREFPSALVLKLKIENFLQGEISNFKYLGHFHQVLPFGIGFIKKKFYKEIIKIYIKIDFINDFTF
jgi:hypothetical protein